MARAHWSSSMRYFRQLPILRSPLPVLPADCAVRKSAVVRFGGILPQALLLSVACISGCSRAYITATPPGRPSVAVSVSPASLTLSGGQAAQLTAAVTNAANKAVTWSISPAGVGSISASGLYTSPTAIPAAQTVTATATSVADSTASSSATITLTPSVAVSVSPASLTLSGGQAAQLVATATNALNPSVTWSALLGTITPGGLYTAPQNTDSSTLIDTITATSIQDPTKSATATVTVSSLVGWWPLDEGTGLVAYDISGQGNNAKWSGFPSSPTYTYYTTYYTAGQSATYTGYLDGSDNGLTVGTQPVYAFTGPFTLSAWANTVSKGTILTKQNGLANGYNLAIAYGVIRFCVYSNTTERCVGGGGFPLSSPTWTYFAAVFDGSTISVYANGVLLKSATAFTPTASTGPLVFGIPQRGGDYQYFAGSLKDIRIYSRALSAAEISSAYSTDVRIPNAPTNLQAFPGISQVGLSWDTPTHGAIITDYIVTYRQTGTSDWMTSSHVPSVANAQVVTGLINGTSYDFQVTPVSGVANGTSSDIITAIPLGTPPAITVSVAPNATSLVSGTNIIFSATVTNALNPSVTWSALLGTITPGGLYTAPQNTDSSTLIDTITATSIQDPTKSATATVTVSSSLVGWWPLDEGTGSIAYDKSGQGNDGTWSGIPNSTSHTYYTAGTTSSYAGYFDGRDNSVIIGVKPVYQFTGPFTLSVWANPVSKGMILSMQNNSINGYNLGIFNQIIRFCVYTNTIETCVSGGSYPLSSPTWTHFTAVFDGSHISIYANGVLLQSASAANPSAATGPLVFGISQRGGYSTFAGSLDDIRIYSRALSENEISSLYNAYVGPPNAPTNLRAFPGNKQVGLSWNTPTQGAIITDYTVDYRQSGTNTWAAFPHDPSLVNQQVITGLTNGTSYDFQVTPVSGIGNGTSSDIVTATPSSTYSSVVPSTDDEFIGPFSSWLNVKTDFGAVGDGVNDDTFAFQDALTALQSPSSHASVLYIPAGTYKITSGLYYVTRNCGLYCEGRSIIGESPTNTILKWAGDTTGSAMLTLDGIYRMQVNRLTMDGSGAPITLINETMHQGCCFDGSNEFTDDVFENAAIGIQAGDMTVNCCSGDSKVERDTFAHLTMAGISFEDYNADDWWIRYCTFEHNNYGVTNTYGAGEFIHLDHNLFAFNRTDAGWVYTYGYYTYNTSYHSGTFLASGPYNSINILIGNTILKPQTSAISSLAMGTLTLINNTIEGTITAAQPSYQIVTLPDGSKSKPDSYVASVGNTYVSATPFSVQNVTYGINQISDDLISIDDAVVSVPNMAGLPLMPGPLPNYHRTIYDVPQGASGATIQATIDRAIAEDNGNRPVVHIPWGQYSVSSTITIPSGSDVQIVGDNLQTEINWLGSTSSPVFVLLPPSHAAIRNLGINAASASAGILVEGYDQPGDRIYTNFVSVGYAAPGTSHDLLVNGFDNTLVQMDDFNHASYGGSSASVLVVGGPASGVGEVTHGYTGLFMGDTCCNTAPTYRVENGGTIVLAGVWYEQGGYQWLDLDGGSGNFIGYADNIAVDSWGTLTSGVPSFTANGFTGNLTVTNSRIGNSYVNLAGSTPANVLLLGDLFGGPVTPPAIINTNTNPKTQAATIYPNWWLMNGSLINVPDEVSPGTSRETLIRNSLIQLASYKDPAITDLPPANEDVRLVDIVVSAGANTFDFESLASGSSINNAVSRAGNRANSGMAGYSSRPTSPWCRRIDKDSRPQGSLETRNDSGPSGTQSLDRIHNCGIRP